MAIVDATVFPVWTINTQTREITAATDPYDPSQVGAVVGDSKSNALVFQVAQCDTTSGKYLAAAAQNLVKDLRDNFAKEGEPEQLPDILIRCINANHEYCEIVPEVLGTSEAEGDDPNYLQFSWVLDTPVTDYAGMCSFSIVFRVVTLIAQDLVTKEKYYPGDIGYPKIGDSRFNWLTQTEYQWQTLPSSFSVVETLVNP